MDDKGRHGGHTPAPGFPFHLANHCNVFIGVEVGCDLCLTVTALAGNSGEGRLVADMFATLELGDEQALDQRLGIALLLRPVNQAMGVERIGAQLDRREIVVKAVSSAGIADMLE